MDLDELNALDVEEAAEVLAACCASSRWARRLAASRPFTDVEALCEEARRIWWDLAENDWLEAFAAHPRIGERREGDDRHVSWSRQEQSGTSDAAEATLAELARLNEEYEQRFGRVYLVFASGRTADEMVELCRTRLGNDPDEELRIAAAEQEKITDLRLHRLLGIG